MSRLVRSLKLGAAFGLAVTVVETALGGAHMSSLGMPPATGTAIYAALWETALGVALGLVTSPVAALAGLSAQLFAIAAIWLGLARLVAPDPSNFAIWLTGPLVGLVLTAIATAIAARRPSWSPALWVVGLAALAAGMAVPVLRYEDNASAAIASIDRPVPPEKAPDIVVVLLDTVRAQSMSAYGYSRPTTPRFDALADEGVLFEDVTSPSTWSLPSHASLFTGWYPSAHGCHGEHRRLGALPPTIAEVLYRSGYDTLVFTANPHLSEGFGLSRGFGYSDKSYLRGNGARSFFFVYRVLDLLGYSASDKGGGGVAANFERWSDTRAEDDRPAFVFLNFLEAHFPYHQVPDEFLAEFTSRSKRQLRRFSLETFGAQFGRDLEQGQIDDAMEPTRNMYDAGVLYSDYLLSRVVDALKKRGTLDNTILVVLSDHGELLGEHDLYGHGRSLHELDLRVPLMFRYPPSVPAGVRVAQPVSSLGLFATLLDLVGIDPPGPVHAESLVPTFRGQRTDSPVFAERFRTQLAGKNATPMAANRRYRVYRSGKLKLVEDDEGDVFLFDVAQDPNELDNLVDSQPDRVAAMRAERDAAVERLGLPALDAPLRAGAEPKLDDATRERLRALGYVD